MVFVSNLIKRQSYSTIRPSQLNQILDNNNVLLLDVRNPGDFRKGHIPNAINIPVNDIPGRLGELNSYKNRIIVVYCYKGSKSAKASEFLSKNGYKKVYNLSGGISSYNGELTRK